MKVTRVLIVDDSPSLRRLICAHLMADPRVEVIGEACDPYEAREMIKALQPDVITLDVEMPKMDGLEFLEKLMRLRPMPVVMLSTLTQAGSRTAIEALSLGAVECFAKPDGRDGSGGFERLADVLIAAAQARPKGSSLRARLLKTAQIERVNSENRPIETGQSSDVSPERGALAQEAAQGNAGYRWNGTYVFIGSSTGGVDALETILVEYPADCPPTLITQHMPESFLSSFARRLDNRIAPRLELARDGVPLKQGQIYLAPGGAFHLGISGDSAPVCRLLKGEPRSGHRPSVDVLFQSARILGPRALGVILTGMGRDGAQEMLGLRHAGGRCFAQDEESSVVFGMPRAALEYGGAERAIPLDRIAREILTICGAETAPAARKAKV